MLGGKTSLSLGMTSAMGMNICVVGGKEWPIAHNFTKIGGSNNSNFLSDFVVLANNPRPEVKDIDCVFTRVFELARGKSSLLLLNYNKIYLFSSFFSVSMNVPVQLRTAK